MCPKTILDNLTDLQLELSDDNNFNSVTTSFYETLIEKCNSIIDIAEKKKLLLEKNKSQVFKLKDYPNLDIYVNLNSESSTSSYLERPLVIEEKSSPESPSEEAINFFSKLNLQKSCPKKISSNTGKSHDFNQIYDYSSNGKKNESLILNDDTKTLFNKKTKDIFEDKNKTQSLSDNSYLKINEENKKDIYFVDTDSEASLKFDFPKAYKAKFFDNKKLESSDDNEDNKSSNEFTENLEITNKAYINLKTKSFTIPLIKIPNNLINLALNEPDKAKKELKKIDSFLVDSFDNDYTKQNFFDPRKRRKISITSLSGSDNSLSESDEILSSFNNFKKRSKPKVYSAIYSTDESDFENKENKNLKRKFLHKKACSNDEFEDSDSFNENSENDLESDDSFFEDEIIEVYSHLDIKNSSKIKIKKEKNFWENENYFGEKRVNRKKLELRNPKKKIKYDINELKRETRNENLREARRVKRLIEIEKKFNVHFRNYKLFERVDSVILEFGENDNPLVRVSKSLFPYFKDYQIESVKFLYRNVIESVDSFERSKGKNGNGCILAHSMGLGKTFQIIAFLHSLFNNVKIYKYLKSALIVTPVNTLINWSQEYKKWLNCNQLDYKIFDFYTCKSFDDKIETIETWHSEGGVLIIGHNIFSSLVLKKQEFEPEGFFELIKKSFLNPGPDIVIVDEGHLMKNVKSQLNCALSLIQTHRRIILTGTPLQNNLLEYFTMINFVRPFLLGDYKEFLRNFDAPIRKGQTQDSTPSQIKFMKKRVHVLQKLLSHVVIRKDHKVLEKELNNKYEYVLKIQLSPIQDRLYKNFIKVTNSKEKNLSFFKDWHTFKLIYNNSLLLKKKAYFYENEEWCKELFEISNRDNLEFSSKMEVLVEILKLCELNDEKLVVFSQSINLLDSIEEQLKIISYERRTSSRENNFRYQTWIKGKDFFRIDGTCSVIQRQQDIDNFNNLKDRRSRLFLISIKAGCLGINLVGSNRCIIFDHSWNPSSDSQAIFRIYRYGQQKPVYIYRFVAYSTWEEKIYSNQVWKESLSYRVVDDKNPDRKFTSKELDLFYDYDPNIERDYKIPKLPEDYILAKVINKLEKKIVSYHEHNSLLENEKQNDLSEDEKILAWNEFESTKEKFPTFKNSFLQSKFKKFKPVIPKAINATNINNLYQSLGPISNLNYSPNNNSNFLINRNLIFSLNSNPNLVTNHIQNYASNKNQNFLSNKNQNFVSNKNQNFVTNNSQSFVSNNSQSFVSNKNQNNQAFKKHIINTYSKEKNYSVKNQNTEALKKENIKNYNVFVQESFKNFVQNEIGHFNPCRDVNSSQNFNSNPSNLFRNSKNHQNTNSNQFYNFDQNSNSCLNTNFVENSNYYYNADSYLNTNFNQNSNCNLKTSLNMNLNSFVETYSHFTTDSTLNNLITKIDLNEKSETNFTTDQNMNFKQNISFLGIKNKDKNNKNPIQENLDQYRAVMNVKNIVKKILTKRKLTTKIDICHLLLFTENLLHLRASKFENNIETSKVIKYELRLIKRLIEDKEILLKLFPEFTKIMNPVFVSDSDALLQKINELD